MAIYDTMQYVKCDVSTICIGLAAGRFRRSRPALAAPATTQLAE